MAFKISNYFLNALEFYLQILECNVMKDNTFMVNTVASLPATASSLRYIYLSNQKQKRKNGKINNKSRFFLLGTRAIARAILCRKLENSAGSIAQVAMPKIIALLFCSVKIFLLNIGNSVGKIISTD